MISGVAKTRLTAIVTSFVNAKLPGQPEKTIKASKTARPKGGVPLRMQLYMKCVPTGIQKATKASVSHHVVVRFGRP